MSPQNKAFSYDELDGVESAEVDSEGSWAVSYGDMVTLLLAFFIIFFSADKFEMKRQLEMDLGRSPASINTHLKERLQAGVYPSEQTKEAVRARTYQVGEKLIVEFSGVSFFNSASTDLHPGAVPFLAEFYRLYQPYMGQYQLGIRAFTDPRPVKQNKRRRFKDNLELSALRAISVMRYFQEQGIPLRLMKISGHGEKHLDPEFLAALLGPNRAPSQEFALARTVVLTIEPAESSDLVKVKEVSGSNRPTEPIELLEAKLEAKKEEK
jgi:chemotaxis protein MotB